MAHPTGTKEVPAEQAPMIVASGFSDRRNFSVRLLGIQVIAEPTRLDRVAHAYPKWCGAIRIASWDYGSLFIEHSSEI